MKSLDRVTPVMAVWPFQMDVEWNMHVSWHWGVHACVSHVSLRRVSYSRYVYTSASGYYGKRLNLEATFNVGAVVLAKCQCMHMWPGVTAA